MHPSGEHLPVTEKGVSALLVTVCFSLPFALFISRPASLLPLMQVIASQWIWTRLAPFWYFMTGPEFFTS